MASLKTALLAALLLGSCAAPQRVDYHAAGGALAFADDAPVDREVAGAVVAEVARRSADPEYRARVLALVADHLQAWHAAGDGFSRLDLAWDEAVIDDHRPEDGYAAHRATSAPGAWLGVEPPRVPAGAVLVRVEAATALSPAAPRYRLAVVPQAALLAVAERSLPGELAREVLTAVRGTQLELLRDACVARGLRLHDGLGD